MREKIILFLFFGLIASISFGQTNSLTSPFHTIKTHLSNLESDQYEDSLASIPFIKHSNSLDEAKLAAIKFKQLLDGEGVYITMSEVPSNPDYKQKETEQSRYIITQKFPEVFLEKEGVEWVFAPAAIEAIHTYHPQVFSVWDGSIASLGSKWRKSSHFWITTFPICRHSHSGFIKHYYS